MTVPPSRKAGLSLASFSIEVSSRGPSSTDIVVGSSRRLFGGTSIGTICSSKRPSSRAATARWWLWSAKRSCSSRETS